MKVELEKVLKQLEVFLGPSIGHCEYARGWNEALEAVRQLVNLDEIKSNEPAYNYEHECTELKKRLDDLTCENKMLRDDRENEKEYSSTLESVLKAVNLLTDTVTN